MGFGGRTATAITAQTMSIVVNMLENPRYAELLYIEDTGQAPYRL